MGFSLNEVSDLMIAIWTSHAFFTNDRLSCFDKNS